MSDEEMKEEKIKYVSFKEYDHVLKNVPLSIIQFIELIDANDVAVAAIQIGKLILVPTNNQELINNKEQ